MVTKSETYRKAAPALLAAAAALGIVLTPRNSSSYATGDLSNPPASFSIHQLLVDKLTAFYPSKKYDINEIKIGTIDEDSADYGYARAFHHFQHWQTGKGIYDNAPVKEWATNGSLQEQAPYGNHSWEKAKEEYQNGTIGKNFGHIFHLIADLTVPAHARLSEHPFSSSTYLEELTGGLWLADFYEVWTNENKGSIMGAVAPKNVPSFTSIEELIDSLAHFTGSNFYSDDDMDGSVNCNWEGKYCMREVEGQKARILRKGFIFQFPDVACMEDRWRILGRRAVEYGAAAVGLVEGSSGSCNPAEGGGSNSVFYDSFDGNSLDTECKWWLISGSPDVANGKINLNGEDGILTIPNLFKAKCQDKDFTLEYNLKTTNSSGLDISFGDESMMALTKSTEIIYQCQSSNNFKKIEGLNLTSYTLIKLQKQGNTLYLYVNGVKKGDLPCTDNAAYIFFTGKNNSTAVDFVKLSCY
ncbi:MAG: hypothetical protein AB1668_02395 [Nanoarchaeota archaeon]